MTYQRQAEEVVYRTGTKADCLTRGLVLEAAGIGNEVHRAADGFMLIVAATDAARARAELDTYASENRDWPDRVEALPDRSSGWAGVLGYAGVSVLVAVLAQQHAFGFDWHSAGKTHAGLIRHGELWRAATALSLHADLLHLAGNIVIGGLFGLFAGQRLGSGLAWTSILVAGTVGNLLNAWVHRPQHTSVGASTAVFAALGILAAYTWTRRQHVRLFTLRRLTPLVGGAVLLSFLGTGSERTDVGAHVAGFLVGLLLGAAYGKLGDRMLFGARGQLLLGVGTVAALAFAWILALKRTSYGTPALIC